MVFVDEGDVVGDRALHTGIVHRDHAAGLHGGECPGYRGLRAKQRHPHEPAAPAVRRSAGPPVVMVIVDETTRVRAFLGDATELRQVGLVTGEDVTAIGPPDGNRPV